MYKRYVDWKIHVWYESGAYRAEAKVRDDDAVVMRSAPTRHLAIEKAKLSLLEVLACTALYGNACLDWEFGQPYIEEGKPN